MPLYPYRGKTPKVAADAWIAPTASIVGDVEIASGASVWFGATIRGDTSFVRIGRGTSVQDNCVIHTDHDVPTLIGANCTLGHGAIVHSSEVGDNVLIGTAAVLTGGNAVGTESLVGAGAVLPEGMKVGERAVVVGVPARVVREVRPEDSRWTHQAAESYRELAAWYRAHVPDGSPRGEPGGARVTEPPGTPR